MSKKKSSKKVTPTVDFETFDEPKIIPEKKVEAVVLSKEEPIEHEVIHYAVRRGDTLESIAEKFDTTEKKILKDSGIESAELVSLGQRLVIKK